MEEMKKRRGLLEEIRHRLNVLHVYAFLCKLTKNKRKAYKVASTIEKIIFYRLLYIKHIDEE